MFREIGFGLLFFSIIFKTIAISKASNKNLSLEIRKKQYKQFNLPGNMLIGLGAALLLYAKYFA